MGGGYGLPGVGTGIGPTRFWFRASVGFLRVMFRVRVIIVI